MFHDIHLTAQRNFSKFEGVGMHKPRENVLLTIMIAKNTFFGTFFRLGGGLKVVKIKKRFQFRILLLKSFPRVKYKKSVV